MPISNETILEANRKMLGKTNRAILFAEVNVADVLNPDVPEADWEATPSLSKMLPRVNEMSNEQFLTGVRDKLTVTNFNEFLKKFQPGFYYQVYFPERSTPPPSDTAMSLAVEGVDGGAEAEASSPIGNDSAAAHLVQGAELRFSLEGGSDWKKVCITTEHPYIACLSKLIKQRVRQGVSTFRVDVDASLFTFQPKNRRTLLRKLAQDVQRRQDHLRLETARNPASTDMDHAQKDYKAAAKAYRDTFQRELEVAAHGLPTILYEPDQSVNEQPALGAVENRQETALSRSEANPTAKQSSLLYLELKLDKLRNGENATVNGPILHKSGFTFGKFMDRSIQRGMIQPLVSNLLAVELQDPLEMDSLSPDIQADEEYDADFQEVYSKGVEDFLKTVTPLFETILGVYLLLNEFPSDVKLAEGMKPELILANADLPDLMLTREAELKTFFDMACAQATNQFRDAISFVIVPNVAELRKKRPKKRADSSIMMDDPLLAFIQHHQTAQSTIEGGEEGGYGRVTFGDELMLMMDWGFQYGFQILFSPEERVRANEGSRDFYHDLIAAYAVESVIERDSGECAVLCIPDFIIMPLDGKLVSGRTILNGIDVPELIVRSCYVACGRLMANDVPAYLQRKLLKAKQDPMRVRMDVPGIGVDLGLHRFLGETDLPIDHFLNDGSIGELLTPEMPFAVFTYESGRSPFLSEPRTLRRLTGIDGNPYYRSMHLFRQQTYLNRLLRAAHELGYGGPFPLDNREAVQLLSGFIEFILKFTAWYNPKMVNTFPSRLDESKQFTVSRQEGNSFKIALGFEQEMISEFGIRFGV